MIPDGTVIEGLPVPTPFTHVTPEEWADSAQRFEDFPEQGDTAAGVDQRNHALFVPFAHNPQIAPSRSLSVVASKNRRRWDTVISRTGRVGSTCAHAMRS